ncbi:hypothetical protein Tco_1531268 [Tanacetum coccineum]
MCTRSQSRNSNRQQQQEVPPTFVEPFNLVEPIENQAPPVVTMADNHTMAQLLEEPTEGYEDAIVVPEITADNFELKHGLLTLVQNEQFFRHDKEDPHAHIRYFNKITSTMKFPNVPIANCTKVNLENKSVNNTLTAELERYKEQVKVLNKGQNVDLKNKDNVSDSCAQSVEIDHLKQTLSENLKEKESLMQTVSLLKDDFKKEESRNIDREISLEKRIKQLDNIIFKRDQSA